VLTGQQSGYGFGSLSPGRPIYQIHLFEDHGEQAIVDANCGAGQLLGGISMAMAPDAAETTIAPRLPGR